MTGKLGVHAYELSLALTLVALGDARLRCNLEFLDAVWDLLLSHSHITLSHTCRQTTLLLLFLLQLLLLLVLL